MRLHIVEADRVSTPHDYGFGITDGKKPQNGNRIFDGAEKEARRLDARFSGGARRYDDKTTTSVRAGEMLHVPNPAARWCFGNVRLITDGAENIKSTKKRTTGRIDMIVSWIIAFATAQVAPKPTLADALASGEWRM